jgi:hypothetical protein
MIRCGILVGAEISNTLELEMVHGLGVGQELLYIAVLTDLKRIGVFHLLESLNGIHALLAQAGKLVTGILYFPQTVIQTDLSLDGVGCADPMDCSLALAVAVGFTGLGIGYILAVNLLNGTVGSLLAACAEYYIGTLEAYLTALTQTEILGGSILHKVLALNPEFAAECYLV